MRARSRGAFTSGSRTQRKPHVDAQTLVPGALDLARPAYQSRPLAHADEAKSTAGSPDAVEADPVVAHVEVEPIPVSAQRDVHSLGPGVLAGVGERFLEDAEGRGLHHGRQPL